MEAKAGGSGISLNTSSASASLSWKTWLGPFDIFSVFVHQGEFDRQVKGRCSCRDFLSQMDAVAFCIMVISGCCSHLWISDPVKPFSFELLEGNPRDLFKAFEKLVCICIAVSVA